MTSKTAPIFPTDQAGARLFTLRNANGMRVTISERGAALVSWWAPDRYGRMADIVLGEPDDGGRHAACWQGAMAHGGLTLRHAAPAGQGVQMFCQLDDDGCLSIEYQATADAPMPAGPPLPPCFNLNGGSGDVDDHMLQIDADYYVEVDPAGIPTGHAAVGGTPFDFRKPAAIGPRLRWPDRQIGITGRFDHCYCLAGSRSDGRPASARALRTVAQVHDPASGRRLQLATTEPGLRFRSGHRPDGMPERDRHDGFCLAAGACPGLPGDRHAAAIFPRPGRVYRQTTLYHVGLQC